MVNDPRKAELNTVLRRIYEVLKCYFYKSIYA